MRACEEEGRILRWVQQRVAQRLERIGVVGSRQSPLIVRLKRTNEELAIYRRVLSSKEHLLTINDTGHLISDGYKFLTKSTIISSVKIIFMSCFSFFIHLNVDILT